MYTRQEASLIKKKFWTSFGQYMRPIKSANEDSINWINYKTGVRNIYFRMDVAKSHASIAIKLTYTESPKRHLYFEQLMLLKAMLEEFTGEEWIWEKDAPDEDGNIISRINKTLYTVNIFIEKDWPAIISFLKPRIIALDKFWMIVKDDFE